MTAPPSRDANVVSELFALHGGIQVSLSGAWDAAISLLDDPDDVGRYLQCGLVAAFLRDARLHIHREDALLTSRAPEVGISTSVVHELRAEHAELYGVIATIRPLLDDPRTVETAALRVLRLVGRFEQHLASEELVVTTGA